MQTAFYGALLVVMLASMSVATGWAWIERNEKLRASVRSVDLQCLAENVYYESRGEPLVGQYAVAEVTMNRVASPDFPGTVCAVVHQRGAFSWTNRAERVPPYGYEWRRAQSVASTVYDNREAPLVNGALFYHATYVSPAWAPTRNQVARIGRHLFYL
jgi:N-acetylmuramoyl-L-alanine amidase